MSEEVRDQRGRLTQRLMPGGETPDPRFSLANERTFLSWIRTGLALQAGGVAVEAFDAFDAPYRQAVAILLLTFGMFLCGGAFVRWVGVERAIREKRPLPVPLIAPILGAASAIGSVVIIILVLTT